jgi:predicted DNA-binding transcriptional regulator AlpA
MKSEHPQREAEGAAVDRSEHLNSTAEPTAKSKSLSAVLAELTAILPSLRDAIERQAAPPVDRLAYRLDELETRLGLSKRHIQREVSAGRFPRPVKVGRVSLWPVETIRAYLDGERGGRRS